MNLYVKGNLNTHSVEQNGCHCTSIEHTLRSSCSSSHLSAILYDLLVGLGSLLRIGLLMGGLYTSFLDLTEAHLYLRVC